jgi:hypothetical protein
MRKRFSGLLLCVLPLAPLGCGRANGDPAAWVTYPFVLTEREVALGRELAERDLSVDGVPSGPRTLFIKMDLLPDSQAETTQRLVMVHHYRYGTDETIFTLVDLGAHEVLRREAHAHYPTALAPSEIDLAIDLAWRDERLRPLLETASSKFDARPILCPNPQQPLFGHRVVHLLLQQDGRHLASPRVLVDLSTETVHLETIQDKSE